MTDTNSKPEVAAEEVILPLERIHPDPFQPRIHPDAELAESIKTQGVLQAITVEPAQPLDAICEHCDMTFVDIAALGDWMINDGERRWLGSIAAGKDTILAKIIPPSTEGDRLKRQLTSNTGKPLTPIEEAFAFKRIMEVEGWSQVELAKQLGRPRSVIGDRIRLVELHPVWLKLIESGRLQVSHGPILSQFREVPAEYQEKAAKNITDGEGWQMRRFKDEADAVIPVHDFRAIAFGAFRDFIIKLEQVRSYKGPVLEIEEEDYWSRGATKMKKVKYAADIKLWRPIKREAEKRRKKAQASMNSGTSNERGPRSAGIVRVAKLDLPKAPAGASYSGRYKRVYGESGWHDGMDPETFLARVKPASLSKSVSGYDANVYSTDDSAIAAAEAEFERKLVAAIAPTLTKVRTQLDAIAGDYLVSGPGSRYLLPTESYRNPVALLARSLGISGTENLPGDRYYGTAKEKGIREFIRSLSAVDADRLATAFAAHESGAIKIPNVESERQKLATSLRGKKFDVPAASDAKGEEKAAKKAAGQQRGKEIAIARKNGATASTADVAVDELEEAPA